MNDSPSGLRFLFLVQGEGRGHLTQAISLAAILREAGHEVVHVLAGKSERRVIPAFFYAHIGCPVETFESPNFVSDKSEKAIRLLPTIGYNLSRTPVYIRSLRFIHRVVQEKQPQVLVNFYEFLGGIYNFWYRPSLPFVAVGHQYFLQHNDFHFPKNHYTRQWLLRANTWITAFGADKKLALSFRPLPGQPRHKLAVVPPLLRKEVRELATEQQPYILVYMTNSGYADEVIAWHNAHPEVVLHVFWDRKDKPETWAYDPSLTFHQINDRKFLEYMRRSSGYVSTAGFESVCEAMYLGKPVMMIPIQGQFEQTCNALDALKAEAGVVSDQFDLSVLMDYLPKHQSKQQTFRAWEARAEELFVRELEQTYATFVKQ